MLFTNKKFRFNTNLSFLVMWIRRGKSEQKCDCICIRIVSQKFQNWLNSSIFKYSFYNILYASLWTIIVDSVCIFPLPR